MQYVFFLLTISFSGFVHSENHLRLNDKVMLGFPQTLKGRDFFIYSSRGDASPKKLPPVRSTQVCRDHIQKVVCLVEPVKKGESFVNRPCLQGGEKYARPFEELYDTFPPVMQKMFCSLEHIYIEKVFFGTAYAGLGKDENGNSTGARMGIRQSVLDESLSLTTWSSWKEQLSFGGETKSYTYSDDLPQIVTKTDARVSDFLYFLVAHEFGHLFDFANNLNQQIDCPEVHSDEDEFPECKMAENSWGSLSWITDREPKVENAFPLRDRLCFYDCKNNHLRKSDVFDVYDSLAQTNFISTYATGQPWDDFAESLAYFLMDQKLDSQFFIDTRQGKTFDVKLKLKSPIFAPKRDYLEKFLNDPNLVYPGELRHPASK